jgi:hypothetical protein
MSSGMADSVNGMTKGGDEAVADSRIRRAQVHAQLASVARSSPSPSSPVDPSAGRCRSLAIPASATHESRSSACGTRYVVDNSKFKTLARSGFRISFDGGGEARCVVRRARKAVWELMRRLFSSTFHEFFDPEMGNRRELTIICYEIRHELVQRDGVALSLLYMFDDVGKPWYEFRVLGCVGLACCGVTEGDGEVCEGCAA